MSATLLTQRSRRLFAANLVANVALATTLGGIAVLSPSWIAVLITLVLGLAAIGLLAYQQIRIFQKTASIQEIEAQLDAIGDEVDSPNAYLPVTELASRDQLGQSWNRLISDYHSLGSLQQALSRLDTTALPASGQGSNQSVLNSLSDGIAITDVDGRVSLINDALSTLLGDSTDAILNQDLVKQLEGIVGEQAASLKSRSLKPVQIEFERNVNGNRQILKCLRRPRLSDKKLVTGHIWMLRDVTQGQLAEEMREQFVSMASHELRTPLANIRAYAETLAFGEDIEVAAQKRFINTIQSEATRLGDFVDDLLDVTRMQAGSMTLDKHEVDLMRLLNEACEKVRGQIEQKGIAFQVDLPEKLPKTNADKQKLAASFVNLLGNAVKYTPDGGSVNLVVSHQDSNLEISVEDTGIGISAEEIGKVFDKFFRSDDERVRKLSGSGIGLAFTREVARLHGGDVVVHSEINKGTRFTMTLPIQQEAFA